MPTAIERHDAPRFGAMLRRHRATRGMSQERLAGDAEISTRHLSCLETGRATPSAQMVLVLGSALDLPLRDRNALLAAAGFAAAYRDEPLAAPQAAALKRAVDLILTAVEPNGAVVVDRAWNLLQANRSATALMGAFMDVGAAPPEVLSNVLVATLHPKGFRPFILNFEEVATMILDRARRESAHFPDDSRIAQIRDLVAQIPDLPHGVAAKPGGDGPFISVHMRRGALEAKLFTTIATIGTPIDATAEELRIETYFPADEATAAFLRSLHQSS